MNDTERIDRLEKSVEKLLKEHELLAIYIPRLTDIINRYWTASGKHRDAVLNDLRKFQGILKEHTDKKTKPYIYNYIDNSKDTDEEP